MKTFLRSKLNGAVFINLKIFTVEGHSGAFKIVTSHFRLSLKFSGIRCSACDMQHVETNGLLEWSEKTVA